MFTCFIASTKKISHPNDDETYLINIRMMLFCLESTQVYYLSFQIWQIPMNDHQISN
jgi:hypothetical protein